MTTATVKSLPSQVGRDSFGSAANLLRDRGRRWAPAGVAAGLIVLVFVVFYPALHAGFINFDDDLYVYNNPLILQGLTRGGIVKAFSEIQIHSGYWAPLTWLSLMLDSSLFGVGPTGYHFTNILLHAVNAALLFVVVRSATGQFWRSALAAAIFAVHPLRVESVVWVTERKDVLSGLMGLIALFAYVRYVKTGRWIWMGGTCLMLALSLMAKGMMVTLPLILLLLDAWPLGRYKGLFLFHERRRMALRLALEKTPLLLICTAGAAITIFAQNARGAVASLAAVPFQERLANAIVGYARYLFKAVAPLDLAVFYPQLADWSLPVVLGCLALLAALSAGAIWQRFRPWLTIGWFWFLIALIPMIGLIQAGAQAMADRFTYFPMMGLSIAAAWSIPWRRPSRLTAVAVALLILVYSVMSYRQCMNWKDSVTLWTSALRSTDENEVARYHLGLAYLECGAPDQAIPELQRALILGDEAHDSYVPVSARIDLGRAFLMKGDQAQALKYVREAVELDASSNEACMALGQLLADMDRLGEAETFFTRATKLDPKDWRPQYDLGVVYVRSGQSEAAIRSFRAALAIGVDDASIEQKLANTVEAWDAEHHPDQRSVQ